MPCGCADKTACGCKVVRDCKVTDKVKLQSRRVDPATGFLHAHAILSRDGIQEYLRSELGLGDEWPEIVRLLRPQSEVQDPKSVASLDGKPLTFKHPPVDVTSKTWKEYAVGDVNNVKTEGTGVGGDIIARDAPVVHAITVDGVDQLSVGYVFDLKQQSGVDPQFGAYDGIMTNIRANHHAIVKDGRCGPTCRVQDHDENRRTPMPATMRKLKTNDASIKLPDGKTLTVLGLDMDFDVSTADGLAAFDKADRHARGISDIKDAYDSKDKEVKLHMERADAAESRLKEMDAMPDGDDEDNDDDSDEADEEAEQGKGGKAKDSKVKLGDKGFAYVERLKAKSRDAAIEARIEKQGADRAKLITDAKPLLAADYKDAGKSMRQIRIDALTGAIGDAALKTVAVAVMGTDDMKKVKDGKLKSALDACIAARSQRATDAAAQDQFVQRLQLGAELTGTSPGSTGGNSTGAQDDGMTGPQILAMNMKRSFGAPQSRQ